MNRITERTSERGNGRWWVVQKLVT